MHASIKGVLLLSAGLLFTLSASSAISQVEDEATESFSSTYAEQAEERDVSSPSPPASPPPQPKKSSPPTSSSSPNHKSVSSHSTLLSSDTLIGVVVNNVQGEKLGTIREIMVDPRSGRLMYAVVDSTASFGMGKQKSFAVPWHELNVNLDQSEIVVQLDHGLFPSAPSVALNK